MLIHKCSYTKSILIFLSLLCTILTYGFVEKEHLINGEVNKSKASKIDCSLPSLRRPVILVLVYNSLCFSLLLDFERKKPARI